MLTVIGRQSGSYCDGVDRRNFLQVGTLGLGFAGMTLADLMRLEAAQETGSSHKAIINVHLGGGPSHQDMWDLKPNAPVEYRGEFNPTKTNVPGMDICEHFPKLAQMADKFSLVRGLIGSVNEHSSNTTQTGYRRRAMEEIGGAPAIGSVISKLQGFNGGAAPFVSSGVGNGPGYLGAKYKYFDANSARRMLELRRIDAERLNGRAQLLGTIDNLRREVDASGQMEAADAFTQRAVDVVLSGKMADALDVGQEDPQTVARYTGNGQGRLRNNRNFLLARRLVEAGVRYVSLGWGGWDTHRNNFVSLREQLPAMDVGLSALISDLHQRGLGDDVSIAIWGEFGRTPRVNSNAGRDHWPRVAACFVSGGAIQGGRVVGASDRIASDAADPVHVHSVLSTLYKTVGIDTRTTQIIDPQGRPRYLLDHREPVSQLV